jgi:hypothetical protein
MGCPSFFFFFGWGMALMGFLGGWGEWLPPFEATRAWVHHPKLTPHIPSRYELLVLHAFPGVLPICKKRKNGTLPGRPNLANSNTSAKNHKSGYPAIPGICLHTTFGCPQTMPIIVPPSIFGTLVRPPTSAKFIPPLMIHCNKNHCADPLPTSNTTNNSYQDGTPAGSCVLLTEEDSEET